MAEQIGVFVVEDHGQFRQYISKALRNIAELQVVADVADGMEAVQKARELQPELILLDIGLPTLNGIEVARRIREVSPTTKILFVSENRSVEIVEAALSTGAGYVVKSDVGRDLLPGVKAVLAGKRFVSASLASHLLVATTVGATQSLSWMLTLISGIRLLVATCGIYSVCYTAISLG